MEAPSSTSQAPRWVVALSLISGVIMVGGATLAGQLVLHAGDAGAAEHPVRPPTPAGPPPTTARASRPAAADDADCAGGCPFAGTACVDGSCRLAPSARWQLTPDAVVVVDGPSKKSVNACITPGREPQSCFVAAYSGAEGRSRYYTVKRGNPIIVTTEQLDAHSVEVVVDGVRGMGPVDRYKATPLLFDKGPMIRVARDGTGVRFRIAPVP